MLFKSQKPKIYLFHTDESKLKPFKTFKKNKVEDLIKVDPLYIINLSDNIHVKEAIDLLLEKKNDFAFSVISLSDKYNDIEAAVEEIDKYAGMFNYSKPNSIEDLEDDIKHIDAHQKAIIDFKDIPFKNNLYTSSINSIRYGFSLINKERIVLYTNRIRRQKHGKDIIGQKCFEVFPYDAPRKSPCDDCGVKSIGDRDYIRTEIHKLSSQKIDKGKFKDNKSDVYFVSESINKLEINNTTLYSNIVNDITSRVLYQEYTKLIQRAKDYNFIITILKYALLGGKTKDFQSEIDKELEKEILNKPLYTKEDIDLFEETVEKLSYEDNGVKRILNFKLGRFRFYRNCGDNFFAKEGEERVIMQVYEAFKVDDGLNPVNDVFFADDELFKFQEWDCKEKESFFNILKFNTATGSREKGACEILIEDKKDSEDYKKLLAHLKESNIIGKDLDELSLRKHLWFDVKMHFNKDLFGYISFDWKGREEQLAEDNVKDEHLNYLEKLINFSTQAIQKNISLKESGMLARLNQKIGSKHNSKNSMLYEIGKELCISLDTLRFELFKFEKGKVEREFLHYKNFNPEDNADVFTTISNQRDLKHKFGKGIIGNALELYYNKIGSDNDAKLGAFNVHSFKQYNEYQEDEDKKVYWELLEFEKGIIQNRYLHQLNIHEDNKEKIELKNCIIAPLVLENRLIGAIKLSNNVITGAKYFPNYNKGILKDVATQLAIRLEIYNTEERVAKKDQIFESLSTQFNIIEGSTTDSKSSITIDDLYKEVIESIVPGFEAITNADFMLSYIIKKSNINDSFKEEIVFQNKEPDKDCYQLSCDNVLKINYRESKEYGFEEFPEINLKNFDPSNKVDNKDNKIEVCISKINNEHYTLLVIYNRDGLNADVKKSISSINSQVSAILKLSDWKKSTNRVMENIGHQITSPLTGLGKIIDNLTNSFLPHDDPDYFDGYYCQSDKRLFNLKLVKSQIAQVRATAQRNRQYVSLDLGIPLAIINSNFNIAYELIHIAANYQAYAETQGVKQIHVETNNEYLNVHLDKQILQHIISVYIDNAIKYTDKSIKDNGIRIDILPETMNNKQAYKIIVSNISRIKISDYDKNRIFEHGVRLAWARKADSHGSGIGLYIVKEICSQIGAVCGLLDYTDDGRTRFFVILPKTS